LVMGISMTTVDIFPPSASAALRTPADRTNAGIGLRTLAMTYLLGLNGGLAPPGKGEELIGHSNMSRPTRRLSINRQ
jgi:hypothetical protein